MNDELFHFKHFSVAHSRSSMKVGVDGVLIGAWADCTGDDLLDVGTGCGVIAMMLAQRNSGAHITAIDLDEDSVEEATANFSGCDWSERLSAKLMSFSDMAATGQKFDRIVSNPPFFNSGIKDFSTPRVAARHQGTLSPTALIKNAPAMLHANGKLAMIVPADFFSHLKEEAKNVGLVLERACMVKGSQRKMPKRVMMEFALSGDQGSDVAGELTMFDLNGNPTEEYRLLGKDFYLKF